MKTIRHSRESPKTASRRALRNFHRQDAAARRRKIVGRFILVVALAIIIGMIIDLQRVGRRGKKTKPMAADEIQKVIVETGSRVYTDRQGLFSIAPPAGWTVTPYPSDTPFNVRFRAPSSAEIAIVATPGNYGSIEDLRREIEDKQASLGFNMNIEDCTFLGQPAIKRTTGLHYGKLLSYDFVQEGVAHHIQISIPHELWQRYKPVLLDVVNTYQPGLGYARSQDE